MKLSQKIAVEEILLNSFCEASFTLIPADEDITKKKITSNTTDNIDAKILNKILSSQLQQYIERIITMIKWKKNLFQGCKDLSVSMNQSV